MPRTGGFDWTDEAIIELRRLVAIRYSASMIAKALSIKFRINLSKNSIISKARRAGVELLLRAGRPKCAATPARKMPFRAPKIIAPATAQPLLPEPPDLDPTINFRDRKSHECAWIPGDPSELVVMCCGRSTHPGRPYCQEHCAMAYK